MKVNGSKRKRTASSSKSRQALPDRLLIRRVGLKIHQQLFEMGKPVEWLSFQSGVARSSIREIIAGRSDPRLTTLSAIARGLGFVGLVDFLVTVDRDVPSASTSPKLQAKS